jgi:[protein-PII] uridylyltransferase
VSATNLRQLRASLIEDRSFTGAEWCRAYASAASSWLADLFASVAPPAGVALIAVGGFGRGMLAPSSDLDLVIVHEGVKKIRQVADAIWYPIWDSGVPLDHSVRTIKELRAAMDSDIKVALGLLDARVVAGDPDLGGRGVSSALELWRTRSARWLPLVDDMTVARHERFGDLAFLLEPDVKEARGGLRDLDLMRSLFRVAAVLEPTVGDRTLNWGSRVLNSARVELQRCGHGGNTLLLQDQDEVASALGMDSDTLMTAVADAARAIAWVSDDGWRRVRSWLAGPKGRGGGGDMAVEPGLVLRDGEVALAPGADPATDLSLALRAAAVSAELDKPMSRTTLERLSLRTLIPEDQPWPAHVLHSLLRLLGSGRPAIAAIESLDQKGVWLRYLPEWAPVRNRPQRNALHRYTVDRHLLETVANASALQSSVRRPDLLLLGALFHDIGKGRGGDHTAIGIELVSSIGPRLGLPPADVSVLGDLVRHHLLLPDVATRRDLDDPATPAAVAAAVSDRDTLELLAALALADGQATGPAAWGPWKAGLVDRLVSQVSAVLAGAPPPTADRAALTPAERSLLSARRLSVSFADGLLLVAAPDQAGLLAAVAGALTLSGLNVQSATTISDPSSSMALLRFMVAPAFDRAPDWARFESDLQAALDGRLDLDAALVERDARYSRFQRPRSASTPAVRVLFDSSPESTIVEVRAPDRGPVLYRVARALSHSGLTITCALVDTLGAEAIDVFYVQPLDDAAQAEVEAAVVATLSAKST